MVSRGGGLGSPVKLHRYAYYARERPLDVWAQRRGRRVDVQDATCGHRTSRYDRVRFPDALAPTEELP